jgi:hypothetical protein
LGGHFAAFRPAFARVPPLLFPPRPLAAGFVDFMRLVVIAKLGILPSPNYERIGRKQPTLLLSAV